MKIVLSMVLLLFIAASCETEIKKTEAPKIELIKEDYSKLDNLKWLIGNWTNIKQEELSYENWYLENDSTLKAHSFTLVKGDTVFAEKVTLKQTDSDVFFTAVAYNQNEDQPVTFKMISSDNGIFTFENPEHDFPTRISYSNPVKDSIHAWIEGTVGGEPRKVDFYFIKE